MSTLIDTTGALSAIASTPPDVESAGGVTSSLNISFLAPMTGEVTATGRTVYRTASTAISEVTVHAADDTLVAIGQVTSRIFRPRKQ